MAKSKIGTEKVTRTITVEEESVILTLTADEARTLAVICCMVGGDSVASRRSHSDAIGLALARVGFGWKKLRDAAGPKNGLDRNHAIGAITFTLAEFTEEA